MRGSGWPPLNSQGIVGVLSPDHPLPRTVLNETWIQLIRSARGFSKFGRSHLSVFFERGIER